MFSSSYSNNRCRFPTGSKRGGQSIYNRWFIKRNLSILLEKWTSVLYSIWNILPSNNTTFCALFWIFIDSSSNDHCFFYFCVYICALPSSKKRKIQFTIHCSRISNFLFTTNDVCNPSFQTWFSGTFLFCLLNDSYLYF